VLGTRGDETNGLFWVRDAMLGASQLLTHSGAGSDPPRLLWVEFRGRTVLVLEWFFNYQRVPVWSVYQRSWKQTMILSISGDNYRKGGLFTSENG